MDGATSSMAGLSVPIDRRTAFRLAGAGAATLVLSPSLVSCGAVASLPRILKIAGTVSAQLGIAIGANEITDWLDNGLPEMWSEWTANIEGILKGLAEQGREFFSTSCYGDGVPPAIFFDSTSTKTVDLESNQLVVAVNDGTDSVAFDPWAWKALLLFIDELTRDKTGDTLAGFRALCRISLVPSDVVSTNSSTESGRSTLLAYKTRNGEVEMNRRVVEDGRTFVQVTATGIPVESGNAASRDFEIPDLSTGANGSETSDS